MLSIQKILVPVVFTDTSRHVVHQAAWLARRFHAEMILLHVVTPLSYPAVSVRATPCLGVQLWRRAAQGMGNRLARV
jgi:nucleotide-binding universal stress UspA family protein